MHARTHARARAHTHTHTHTEQHLHKETHTHTHTHTHKHSDAYTRKYTRALHSVQAGNCTASCKQIERTLSITSHDAVKTGKGLIKPILTLLRLRRLHLEILLELSVSNYVALVLSLA